MRPPTLRVFGELVVDNFAGAGGASVGIEAAIGRPVDIAVNHDPEAIAVHWANHPRTRHLCEDVRQVDPRAACGSRPVGLAWFSPDCTHFSRAKGDVPVSKEIRGLAWVVVRWAESVRPRVIVVENVEEWQTWGPLGEDGRPDKARSGSTFRAWLARLSGLGYSIDFRTLVAADYGSPTTRKRLFLVARRDGKGISWPEPTHGEGRPRAWRPAAEVIDWGLPCPSIFGRARPLAEATLRRIAAGIRRYVLEAEEPFVIPLTHQGGERGRGISEPLPTVTGAHRGELALVDPFVMQVAHRDWAQRAGCRSKPLGEPLGTVTASNRFALVSPALIQSGYGERRGQRPRVLDLGKPLGTVVNGRKHGLVAAFLARHFGGVVGRDARRPVPTVTARDHHSLASVFLAKFNHDSAGTAAGDPLPTITAGGGHVAEVVAFLTKFYGRERCGENNQDARGPLHTITSRDRFALVEVGGQGYAIADIGMRMLQPHELFLAQGFPEDYDIDPDVGGRRLTKAAKVRLVGNSVCPQVAEAVVRENVWR